MPIFEIETDQGVFEIDADREPTQEEALLAISGQSVPPSRAASAQQGVFQGDSMAKDVLEAIPGYGSPSEFQAGLRSGEQLRSPAVAGQTLSTLANLPGISQILDYNLSGGLGVARAIATLLNPIGKTIGFAPRVTQAAGSASGGDINAALQDLTGSRQVQSAAEIPTLDSGFPILDVPANTLSETINEAFIKNPPAILGLTPRALASQGAALRNFPANVATAGEQVAALGRKATAPLRSSAPVDPVAVEAAVKRVQDLEFQREQNRINTSKTAEARSAQDLILQEEILRAQNEAATLGSEAIRANQELGPQIESLLRSAQEASGTAQGFRGRLPVPEEASRFGTSISQAVEEATGKARTQAAEDYSAVKESVGQDQPKLPSSNVEVAAADISQRKSQGYSAALQRTLKSVLGESSKVKEVDPLSGLSNASRDIYERLPESQKQSFLDQAGIDLAQTKSKTYTWDQLQQRYQDLNRFIEEARAKGNNQDAAAFQQLKNATSADMNAYAEAIGTDTKALFDEANARFAANREVLGTSAIGKIASDLAIETPESIVNKIVGGEKASVVNNLKQVLSPEKFQEVQSQYADRMMSPSKGVPFDPNHFIKQFESINNETIKAVFGEDGFTQLKNLDQMSKDAIKAQELQKTLDDYNSKAQKAEDAYQRVKSSAEEKRILESAREEAEAAIDSIKDEKFKRDIEKARADLKAAQTPERISLIIRSLYGLLSFGTFAVSGAPVAGIIAGVAAAALGRMIHRGSRSIGSQLSKALEKKN